MRRIFLLSIIAVLFVCGFRERVWAGAPWGEVLPKGKSWLLTYYIGTWASEKYDSSGAKVPAMAGVDTDGKETYTVVEYAYGITDDITAGISVPYATRSIEVTPVIAPRQESTGLGDIKIGGQYRYYKSDTTTYAFRSSVKLATGHVDDPRDQRDYDIGTGQPYIELTNFVDHYFAGRNWVISGMVRFNIQLPGTYDTPPNSIAAAGGTYSRDPGDELWMAAGLERRNIAVQGLSASMRVEERVDSADNVTSRSSSFNALREKDTAGQLLFLQPEIKYSAFKTYKLPARIYANYRIPLVGVNNYLINRLEIGVDIFF